VGLLHLLSYRTKITLAFSLLAFLGVFLVSSLFLYTGYQELRSSRLTTGLRMAACLASNISRDVAGDALFPVFETLQRFSAGWPEGDRPDALVLDPNNRIFATTLAPARDYLDLPLEDLGAPYTPLLSLTDYPDAPIFIDSPRGYFAVAPIQQQEHRLGSLIIDYPLDSLRAQSWQLFRLVLGYSLLLLALLWLIGWLLGGRMVQPLLLLRERMLRVGRGDLDVYCEPGRNRDEFADLARGFDEMVKGLREKEALKGQIMKAERLAAIGRVAAGMAHEINNPLGGMLNAIGTYRKHGDNPEVAHRTLDLLDRGLAQLRNTVQALLVNARLEDRMLTAQDLDDVRTLVEPQARKQGVRLGWDCPLEEPSGVPSSQIRQVLMNLVLNALRATPEEGQVQVTCSCTQESLELAVSDTGRGIPAQQREHLFEPFLDQAQGTGLGLWVSFQIVTGLGGSIEALPLQPGTRIQVWLPRSKSYPPTTTS
jgi:signal transduction histidine kinase